MALTVVLMGSMVFTGCGKNGGDGKSGDSGNR